jgi:L-ascorbate metabolism protein UlaG (beta-lactamase superfamily)
MMAWRSAWSIGGLLVLLSAGRVVAPVQADQLEITFIGNMAFRVTDGQTALLTDFPHRPGASGSMEHRIEEVGPIHDGVTLITHDAADHWDPALFRKLSLKVIAPPAVTKGLPAERVVAWGDRMTYKDILIQPIVSPRAAGHVAYLVVWHGVRLFFSGDTEDLQVVTEQSKLDALFVTPWIIRNLLATGATLDAELLVVCHHQPGEDVPLLPRMLLPQPGDTFRIDTRQ